MITAAFLMLASIQATPGGPIPDGHRPFGPPRREDVLEGWETFIEDIPPPRDCENIGQSMVHALNPPARGEAVRLLSDVPFREMSEADAARMLGLQPRPGQPLASLLLEQALTAMRERKYRAEVERRDGWSQADQRDYEQLTARLERGDHRRYRPYLVRAVSKFGDGHDGAPTMSGDLCGGDLHLQTLVFSYTIPPSVRVPAIVFLPRPPTRIVATVMVAW